jgi:hypothetical protein
MAGSLNEGWIERQGKSKASRSAFAVDSAVVDTKLGW